MDSGLLLKQINQEIEDYKTRDIQIVPNLPFNQHDTLELVHFYYNSKFQSGELDEDGDKKYFRNIVKNPCKVFTKAIDFDTKNIRLLTAGGGNPLKTWYMERDLKYWMRDRQFGKVLNRIFKELPIYGSVVLKVVEGEPHFVDLRNFVVEQSADTLDDSNHLIEVHNYTPAGFRKIAKQMGWDQDKVDEVIENFHKMKDTSHIRLFERYGEVPELKDDGSESYSYRRVFHADVGVDIYDDRGELTQPKQGVLLESKEWEGHPYWEFHAEKVAGRWLGVGVVETLFEPQVAVNQHINLQSKSAFWSALRVFQTRDNTVNRNMLTDIRNGEILNTDSEITQVDMSDRNLAFFNDQDNKWMTNRDELTFSYDVVQGERLPAGTPLGSAQIAQSQTLSYFETIQENVALDVKQLLFEVIIPRFQEENTAKHTLRLVGQDLDQYVEMVKNDIVMKQMFNLGLQSLNGGKFPTNEDRDAIGAVVEETLKQGKERILTIPKGFYKNIKYDVDIDITGESVDTRVRQATIFAMLQAITADPTMTQDPTKRKMLFWMAENGGINPNEIFETQKVSVQDMGMMAQGRAGGGVSAPALESALPGEMPTTV